MKEMVTLNKKEQSRLMVLNGIEMGRVTGKGGICGVRSVATPCKKNIIGV
jgi:hypothetical protein